MDYQDKSKDELVKEIAQLRVENSKLKKTELAYEKIEKELAEQHRLYLDLANTSPAGIYRVRVTPDGQSDKKKWIGSHESPYHFEFCNDRFCEIFNVEMNVIEENPALLLDSVFEEDRAEWASMNIKANLEVTPFIWEGRLLIGGNISWVHFESLPRRLENGDILWTGILYDISKRIKAEQTIKNKTEQLYKANAEKIKFFSIISHDLKSPLSSIVSFSEILSEQVRKKDWQQIKKYSDIIGFSSHNAMNLLMNLIEWSLSQSGMMQYKPEYFDLTDTISESSLLFTDIAEQKSITLSSELSCKIPVFGDETMIGSILRNLISNAIKFTHPEGKVHISTKLKQQKIIVSISDTGVGISELCIEKIFSIDGNCSTYGTQNESGTGLGLILCKEFIQKHNGEIWVESETDRGSIFHFTLPAS